MQIMQSRRDFLTTPVRGRRRGLPWREAIARRRGAAGDDHDPASRSPNICVAPVVHRRGSAARGRLHRYPLRSGHPAGSTHVARGEIDFDLETAAWVVSQLDAGEPVTALAGVHPGCYELFAHEPIRSHQRPEGQEGRHRKSSARAGTCSWRSWRPRSGSTRTRTSTGSRARPATPWSCSPRAGRCFPRLPARAAGAARPQVGA